MFFFYSQFVAAYKKDKKKPRRTRRDTMTKSVVGRRLTHALPPPHAAVVPGRLFGARRPFAPRRALGRRGPSVAGRLHPERRRLRAVGRHLERLQLGVGAHPVGGGREIVDEIRFQHPHQLPDRLWDRLSLST